MLQLIGPALVVIGMAGFFGAMLLPTAGHWLDGVDLPTFYETTTIAVPGGGSLTATMPTQRVQSYGSDGRFRNGWFVDAKGGRFAIGLTTDNKVAVCTGRGRQFLLYDFEGQLVGGQACFREPQEIPNNRILQPADFPTGNLQPVFPDPRPSPSLSAILLVPLWHPFVTWAIGLLGVLLTQLGRFTKRQAWRGS